jgi:chromosomal replication initiator protein
MNPQQAWQATLGQLQMEMTKAAYETWVNDSELVSSDDSVVTIGVHNAYARDWLASRLSSTVSRILTGLMGRPQEVTVL